jgi:hypothetical protein
MSGLGDGWSRDDMDFLAYELRRGTPLLEIAASLKRDVVEVETMADRIDGALPPLSGA